MTNLLPRWTTPGRLALLPIVGLVIVLASREPLGIQADPLRVISAFLAGTLVLALAALYPAAFVAPVLFLPRLKEVSALNGLGEASDLTALQLAGGLLGVGLILRWLLSAIRLKNLLPHHDANDAYAALSPTSRNGSATSAFLLFAAAVSLSYIYTASPDYGGEKLVGFLTLGVGLFFASSLLFTSERDFRDMTIGTALFGMVVAASSLSFSATGAMGANENAAHIGKGQVIGLSILLLLYTHITNRLLRIFVLMICIPILALGLVSAETRGPLFSLGFVLILSYFVKPMRSPLVSRQQMAIVAAVLVGAVMLLSVFWFYGAVADRFRYKAAETIALLQGDSQARGTAVQRLGYYSAALDAWFRHPLFGWGIGGWSMAYWHQDDRQYPHNLFLEVLVEQGLAGFSLLLFFLTSVFRHLRSGLTETAGLFPFLLPCAIYLLCISMFSGDLDDSRFVWFWCGLTLVGCARRHRIHADSSRQVSGTESHGFSQSSAEVAPLSYGG